MHILLLDLFVCTVVLKKYHESVSNAPSVDFQRAFPEVIT